MKRRDLLKAFVFTPIALALSKASAMQKEYAMVIDVSKCIGCGRCVVACKIENEVPMDLPISRTWIEGYFDDRKIVMNTAKNPFLEIKAEKAFFVPKLCNHCQNAPCVNVCPVNARFHVNGIVLVNKDVCIGCKYCITACPYGATFVNPEQKITDKCTFCYHRISKGLKPACVLVCPTNARIFGEAEKMEEIIKKNKVRVLKPEAGTKPRVYYINLDGDVV